MKTRQLPLQTGRIGRHLPWWGRGKFDLVKSSSASSMRGRARSPFSIAATSCQPLRQAVQSQPSQVLHITPCGAMHCSITDILRVFPSRLLVPNHLCPPNIAEPCGPYAWIKVSDAVQCVMTVSECTRIRYRPSTRHTVATSHGNG